jgi:PAS domain S-box-containing protein
MPFFYTSSQLENALDLDELFHDCYFGDFPVPEDVTSDQTALPTKRSAETAGITSKQPQAAAQSTFTGTSKVSAASLTESQKIERRERNREHAKRSRLRKKFLLESLQEQIEGLQSEIVTLKDIIRKELPDKAIELLKDLEGDNVDGPPGQPKKGDFAPLPMPSGFGPVKTLMEPDYRLMSALSGSQQNFAISDPSLPDNPIVYVSQGFLDLTGYSLDQVLGRNCRFLQGPGTDQAAVDVIRKGVREGVDTSVCLLNYKADGSPFWNQFFVAALRDAENNVVNFVGVQCEVSKAVVDKHISEGKTPAMSS